MRKNVNVENVNAPCDVLAMDKSRWVASQIRALRKRAGYTLTTLSKLLGYKTPSGWQRYENADEYSGGYISRDLASKLELVLAGRGSPPIDPTEIWALAGPEFTGGKAVIASFDPDTTDPDHDPDWEPDGVALVDGRLNYARHLQGGQPEVAARAGMGLGQVDDRSARVVSNGIVTGHPVTNEWVIPANYVRNALDARPSEILIIPVIGHSMAPVLQPNDRVLVDVSQNAWLGDAVYIIDDGDGVFQAKTVKKLMSSNPPRYRIVSEASPDDDPVILNHDEFRIVGRVVGRFTRM